MTEPVYMDTETYSEEPISNGTYKYAANAEIMLFTWAVGDGDVHIWDATEDHTMPKELYDIIKYGEQPMVWQNSMFDRSVLGYARGMWMDTSRIEDTMVIALQHGLPGGLDRLCDIFNIHEDETKHKEGKKLIHLFCKPRPKNMELRRATKETHPEEWEKFKEYAINDIKAMRAVYKKLPKWNHKLQSERALWLLDQKINDRGFLVDIDLAKSAVKHINREQKRLKKAVQKKSGGMVEKATQRDRFLEHILMEHGVALPDLTKSTLERRLNDPDLPDAVRELIAIRQDASTTSTSKYQRLIDGVNEDNRLRGTLQFCGAQRTGRWAGRTFQPQNLPRPTHSQDEINFAIKALKADCLDLLSDDTMKLISSTIRGCIVADEGKKLVVSDLSNIEGRVAAWLAKEEWKIKAFADFDEGIGHDLYKLAYARSFSVTPEEVDKEKRQLGKVQELALGYGGGVGAFVTMVSTYRMDLNQIVEGAWDSTPDNIKQEAFGWWEESVKTKKTYGLEEKVFVTCDSLKRLWRKAQPNIAQSWWDLENAVRQAINTPDSVILWNYLKIKRSGAWLRIQLPSGRALCYPQPEIREDNTITYLGVCPYSRGWKRIKSYGGKFFENVCQAVARDVMADRMLAAERAGFEVLLTVHDELITETPEETYVTNKEEYLSTILSTQPEWAKGLPLAAGGFEGYRYRKE